jgi:hypothetical protein
MDRALEVSLCCDFVSVEDGEVRFNCTKQIINYLIFGDPEVFHHTYGMSEFFQILLGLSPRYILK